MLVLLDLVTVHPTLISPELNKLVTHMLALLTEPLHVTGISGKIGQGGGAAGHTDSKKSGGGRDGGKQQQHQSNKMIPQILHTLAVMLQGDSKMGGDNKYNFFSHKLPRAFIAFSPTSCYNAAIILHPRYKSVLSVLNSRRKRKCPPSHGAVSGNGSSSKGGGGGGGGGGRGNASKIGGSSSSALSLLPSDQKISSSSRGDDDDVSLSSSLRSDLIAQMKTLWLKMDTDNEALSCDSVATMQEICNVVYHSSDFKSDGFVFFLQSAFRGFPHSSKEGLTADINNDSKITYLRVLTPPPPFSSTPLLASHVRHLIHTASNLIKFLSFTTLSFPFHSRSSISFPCDRPRPIAMSPGSYDVREYFIPPRR